MGILVTTNTPAPAPKVDQATVDAVAALMKAYCAPTTWTKTVASLRTRKFPFVVK